LRSLKNGSNRLVTLGIVENTYSNGFGDREKFRLTRKAKKDFLFELNLKNRRNRKGLIVSDKIAAKKLFYNEGVTKKVARLSSLLQPENFAKVRENLGAANMRGGFACLFYGPPGTGKTETVYQIARETGRDIMLVDEPAGRSPAI
jgi:DNA replication protein DnaC